MSNLSRSEHMEWCKTRAHQALNDTTVEEWRRVANAVASMILDLGKHEWTQSSIEAWMFVAITVRDIRSAVNFIDWFN